MGERQRQCDALFHVYAQSVNALATVSMEVVNGMDFNAEGHAHLTRKLQNEMSQLGCTLRDVQVKVKLQEAIEDI